MSYYQIKNLQALDNYLELLGAQNISELSKGKGNPPREVLEEREPRSQVEFKGGYRR